MSIRYAVRRLLARDFQSWVALLTVVNVLAFFFHPTPNPIHELVHPWDTLWALTYGAAGVLMLIGIIRPKSAHIEAAGLMLLIAGLLVQILVFASLGVPTLIGTWFSVFTLSTLVVFAAARVTTLVKSTRMLGGD